MTKWLPVLALPGGLFLFFLVWLFTRPEPKDTTIDTLIVPPVQNPKYAEQDDSLRIAAEARRAIANDRRRQAQSIESGKPVESRIRIVGSR